VRRGSASIGVVTGVSRARGCVWGRGGPLEGYAADTIEADLAEHGGGAGDEVSADVGEDIFERDRLWEQRQ